MGTSNQSTTVVRLWFSRETAAARQYWTTPPGNREQRAIWIPKSIIEHTSKQPNGLHQVTLPDWFIEKEGI